MPALPKPNESTFLPPPAGTHSAACCRVIDLGTQDGQYKGKPKRARKLMITWELFTDERMNDGRPFTIGKKYTWSMSEKAALRKDLEMWRGRPLADSEMGEGGFEIKNILGAPCFLTVMHETSGDTTYANVAGVTKVPKGMTVGGPEGPTVYLWLSPDEFDPKVFDSLSEKMRDIIRASPEYKAIVNGTPVNEAAPPDDGFHAGHDPNDEIPF
jgi:hypothetical protein